MERFIIYMLKLWKWLITLSSFYLLVSFREDKQRCIFWNFFDFFVGYFCNATWPSCRVVRVFFVTYWLITFFHIILIFIVFFWKKKKNTHAWYGKLAMVQCLIQFYIKNKILLKVIVYWWKNVLHIYKTTDQK